MIAVISFMASALHRVGVPCHRCGLAWSECLGSVVARDEGFVGVGLLVVHAEVACFEHLVGQSQVHEQPEDLQDDDRDESIPDDHRECGAELDQYLSGMMAPEPTASRYRTARGALEILNDVRVG